MSHSNRKIYEEPALNALGDLKEITEAGGLTNSDDGKTADNAFPNPIS